MDSGLWNQDVPSPHPAPDGGRPLRLRRSRGLSRDRLSTRAPVPGRFPRVRARSHTRSLRSEKAPGIRSFLPQRLLPIMLDCPGSDVTTNSTGSRKCPKQSTIALDFILDLVNTTNIDTNAIAIIAPYQSNVNLINRLRASPRYSPLSSMRPATTVDYFQGREADIVIAVMGTNSSSGPGFTCDAHRLNVMLTRQRCGLVIVADVTVVPSLGGPRRDKVLQDKRGSRCGEQVDVTMLWNVYNRLRTDGRIARCDPWSVPSLVSTPSRAWSSSLTTLWPQ